MDPQGHGHQKAGKLEDLKAKIASSKHKLADPSLAADKKAKLQAKVTELEAKLQRSADKIANPGAHSSKTHETKTSEIQQKIEQTKHKLAQQGLPADKKAKIEAKIQSLEAKLKKTHDKAGAKPAH